MIMTRLLTNLRSSMRTLLCASLLLWMSIPASAQRFTDNLDRGLVAVKLADNGNSIGTLVSWRRLSTEYFDVTYNLYYNGTLLAQNINNTNYVHGHSITGEDSYEVAAVVRGVEQEKCDAVTVWPGWQMYRNGDRYVGGYMDIPLGEIRSRGNQLVTDSYWANDIEVADLDGDGELEFIIKRMNMDDANALYVDMADPAYDVIEAYEFDGTRLWWIDVGANMVSGNSTETNVIAFDWDEDGAAEVILRGADDMVIHYMENGFERTQNIGTYGLSTRNTVYHAANATYTNTGNEYLIYLNGATGKPYSIGNDPSQPWITYPLPRLEQGETDVAEAWWYSAQYTGTGKPGLLGHRDSKYFMGAPYLDGQHPSLFLGRGIYTRHKMIAMNVDPTTHKLSEIWRWNCNDRNSPWFGNGYHNFLIADVDEDGRDEIVYGSMVIDDNGKGLHTTGLGHGDAQHVSDFNPWRKGLEFFGCLEDSPGSNYRDATTGEILFRHTQAEDDGRALMANFSNNYPGCYGRSAGGAEFSSVTNELINGLTETLSAGNLNFRIYWDGDLLSEWQDAAGSENGYITIEKPGRGRIFNAADTKKDENNHTVYYNTAISNNSTKHNTCFQGDIIGDWREEFIARVDARTIRLYTTGVYSEFSLPSLWFDHQYRQAMATQEMVYNLPPNVSYFIGELEGYTTAPPPSTMAGRQGIGNGGTIAGNYGGQLIACEMNDMTISVSDGAQPWVFIDNAPTWVQGHDNNNNITTETYTHTLTGGAFTGGMRLVKQGNGKLVLPSVTETYTGNTDVWAGTLQFDGTMQNSPVWMNRHTTLNTTGGNFSKGLTMDYGATLNMGGETSGTVSAATVSDLTLNYGSQVVFDVVGTNMGDNDLLTVNGTLTVDKKTGGNWESYGPEHLVPVFVLRSSATLESGDYPIAKVEAFGDDAETDIAKIKLNTDNLDCDGASLLYDATTKVLYLHVDGLTLPEYGGTLNINVTGMEPTQVSATDYPSAANETFYLPIVSVTAPGFSGITPTVSGTFTALDGSETNLGSSGSFTLYNQDYERASGVSDWTSPNASDQLTLKTGDATYGKYFCFDFSSTNTNDRSASKTFADIDWTVTNSYTLEFDASLKPGTDNNKPTEHLMELTVMAEGGTISNNNNYHSANSGANYLLDLSNGGSASTTYTVNGGATTVTIPSATWCHYKLVVDGDAGTVVWTITNNSTSAQIGSGTFILPSGTSYKARGLYINASRYYPVASVDNIQIYYTKDFSSYTFTKPGTLTLKASAPGYKSKIETFTVPAVYYKYYESPDYNQIQAAEAASVLGSDYWNEGTTIGRWGNWSKTNGIYGENYVMATGKQTSGYFDKDKVLQISYNQSTVYNQLVQGFGIGHNKTNSTCDITAERLGNSNSILYYKADLSRGGTVNYDEGYTFASDEGKFSYTLSETTTFCKFIAYLPVMLSDEESSLGTVASDCGNALVYRTGLGSGWGTMVLPYSMTADQLKDAFGDDVKVANLSAVDGTVLKFDETTQAVTGGVPFLISGVTKSGPFVAKGVTDITTESSKNVGGIDFIGTYINMGSTPFTTKDYFFVTNSNKLTRVSRDGMKMVLKGYRAYFHDSSAAGAKSFTVSIGDSDATGIDDINAEDGNHDVYDLQGRKVASDLPWSEAKRLLRQGVYIVNGKRMIVK